jgi:hypothetical protein
MIQRMKWLGTWLRDFLSRTTSTTSLSEISSLKRTSKKKGLKLSTVRKLWYEINEKVFDGQLHEPVLRITRSNGYYGKCVCVDPARDPRIAIYISGPMHRGFDLGVLRDSISHEMIHQWQYENGLRYNDNHDETFTKWLPIIEERLGIKLQDSWSESTS